MSTGPERVVAERATDDDAADVYVLMAGHVLFAILIALGTVRAALDTSTLWVPVIAALGTAAWYCAGAIWVERRTGRLAQLWLSGLILSWLGLLIISGEFVWLAFLLALLVWHLFPMRTAIGVEIGIALASAIGFEAHQGSWVSGAVIGPIIGVGCAAVITEIYQRMRAQSEERRHLVDELTAAQHALAEREREAGQLAERERVAGEIHDTVGQSLASVIMLLRAALGAATDEDRTTQLRTALDTASGALTETRRFVLGLATPPVDNLAAALRACADDTSGLGLPTAFAEHGARRQVPAATRLALVRATQEALVNARKHSGARTATVTLTYLDEEVSIDIVDDGVGFDPDAVGLRPDGSGYGLTAMRSRVGEVGGDVTVESEPGAGTAIRATTPSQPRTPPPRPTVDRAPR